MIREFNQWQIDGFDRISAIRINALIEYGLQTFDDDYHDCLKEMKEFVQDFLNSPKKEDDY